MANDKFEIDAGIGDISDVLHAAHGVADLSWLVVDEAEYRKQEALPMQNLDIIPELQKALVMTDEDEVPRLIPSTPFVMVNRNPLDSPDLPKSDPSIAIRNRVARMVMENTPSDTIRDRILLEFSPSDVRLASEPIKDVISERGLLGNVYVNASHFPGAVRSPSERKIARSLGKNAMFVVGGCGGCDTCNCHQTGTCSTFGGKRVVAEVPYSAKLAAHYAAGLVAENRPLDFSKKPRVASDWKRLIQESFLKIPVVHNPDGVVSARTHHKTSAPKVTMEQMVDLLSRTNTDVDDMSAQYVKYSRRMMAGKNDVDLLVASTDPKIRALASEHGLLGHTWLDADALGGCRKTLDFMYTSGKNSPDFIVRRSASCSICQGTSDGACAELCRISTMVREQPSYDRRVLAKALLRAVASGRIANDQAKNAVRVASESSDWKSLTRQANTFVPSVAESAKYSGARVSAFTGSGILSESRVDAETIRTHISHMMNSGLSGPALYRQVLAKFDKEDLSRFPELGSKLSSEDGVQGHHYIDPTAYSDYGRGCAIGAKSFRKRGAANILASSGCNGCSLQTAPGWCSAYSKNLIRSVPTEIRSAVVAARRTLPVIANNVETPVEKYGLAFDLVVDEKTSTKPLPEISVLSPDT